MGWRGALRGNNLHGYSKRIHMHGRKAASMLRHGMCVEIDAWNMLNMFEGSLEAKLPTIMDRWKSTTATEKIRDGESQIREKMQVREKVGKSGNNVFFQCFVAPEGRKVGCLKQRVRNHLGRLKTKNCTPL